MICSLVAVGTASSNSAAAAAAAGADAEVPKKFGKLSLSKPTSVPKKVVFPPSAAVNSGPPRSSGVASRLPCVSSKIGMPPTDENPFRNAPPAPNSGVLKNAAAPTAIAPAAFEWPNTVGEFVSNSRIVASPDRSIYCNSASRVPSNRVMTISYCCVDPVSFVNSKISTGSLALLVEDCATILLVPASNRKIS